MNDVDKMIKFLEAKQKRGHLQFMVADKLDSVWLEITPILNVIKKSDTTAISEDVKEVNIL